MLITKNRQKSVAFLIYVVSCITDLLDGYLARKWKQTSSFGAFLDPVADKLMVSTAMIFLVAEIPMWWFTCPVALIICREIAVSALREWMAERRLRAAVQVGSLGKIKTFMQMVSTALLLETCPGARSLGLDLCSKMGFPKPPLFLLGIALMYISAALTLVSGFEYFRAAAPLLNQRQEPETNKFKFEG